MTPKTTMTRLSPLLLLALGACSSSSAPQDVSGTLALTTFSSTPTAVRAMRGGKVAVEAPVGADGSFHLRLPAHAAYHLEVAADRGKPTVVFPRAAGGTQTGFYVGGNGQPFDMGTLRNMGSPAAQTYAFDHGDMACKDGHEPATGAVCVDDDDERDGANHQCGESDDDGAGAADGENVQTDEAVVADHNLPGVMGCGGDERRGAGDNEGAQRGAGGACDGEHQGAGGAPGGAGGPGSNEVG